MREGGGAPDRVWRGRLTCSSSCSSPPRGCWKMIFTREVESLTAWCQRPTAHDITEVSRTRGTHLASGVERGKQTRRRFGVGSSCRNLPARFLMTVSVFWARWPLCAPPSLFFPLTSVASADHVLIMVWANTSSFLCIAKLLRC